MSNVQAAATRGGQFPVKQVILRNISVFRYRGLFLEDRRRKASVGTIRNRPETGGRHGALVSVAYGKMSRSFVNTYLDDWNDETQDYKIEQIKIIFGIPLFSLTLY